MDRLIKRKTDKAQQHLTESAIILKGIAAEEELKPAILVISYPDVLDHPNYNTTCMIGSTPAVALALSRIMVRHKDLAEAVIQAIDLYEEGKPLKQGPC